MDETERPNVSVPSRSVREAIDALMSPALDRLIAPVMATGPASGDGVGHLPFLAWLVAAVRPALAVGITRRRLRAQTATADPMARGDAIGTVLDLSSADSHRSPLLISRR